MQKFTTDVIIGLEIHAELKTKTKLFCACPTQGSGEPNSRTCATCLGMPGSKPVLNRKAVEHALRVCLALDSGIAKEMVFSRKSYFYPDMSKNYQITQYELPIGTGGSLKLESGKTVSMKRVHLEEDPASLVHPAGVRESSYVLVDYNRSGQPLIEMVTEPEMHSPEEARDFLKQLITVLDYLGVFDSSAIIKADANVSIRESHYTRVEIKNITGFKEIERALGYEVARQREEVREGKAVAQETRSWDSEKGATFSLRKKETEDDYGYIIDPDLVPITIDREYVDGLRSSLPELAQDKLKKFRGQHGIEETTARVLAKDKALAAMYEAVSGEVNPQLAANWVRRELPRVLNYYKKSLGESGITPMHMISLLKLIEQKRITEKTGQRLIEKLGESAFDVEEYVTKEGLGVISDSSLVEQWCREAIKEAPGAAEEYRKGNEKSFNFLVGQVMRKAKGKADPQAVNGVLKGLLRR
ncbi:TPA: Asp-tRNA(Asn)/Glu-tRNA(Gln) amidotransferase subunit GatB [Candidatus Woesearchaeota archaeon]|nr:MAG: aspartyl-tRNA(Asn)/glutamyl-tRNA (Gln) amidotransferase subunit B [archaeon GW2011_AR11]MBS3110521.1 Asp-tRNA(Asn)/Glu-tRNA(Gln) amidotransferase subunit GatB [Candidatus Woesearchaeota archaeon]HIH05453.1 Asp-tRNA(Asn)/Glu-tRNA(Gln) amidotransferase subunit GatB [Candidatus Woesearchaeota archaeon]HIH91795.1 Asp-tRNA(Asn)/Glu-tRNA(Gln) amidotransferase subunit GatB [Candidatus Woesearchaeota archaeon]HII65053.1 Asp-tRNA(Asn)/Glu-tRNA(Gln) amidotransferase subunit GatB [Candidatus Woese